LASTDVIAIDGKPLRRSYQKKGAKAPIHIGSAFAARQRLVLEQIKVAEKSVAIPKLLDPLAIENGIVSIDAMGCQRDIAKKIIDKKADYVLALEGKQSSLREDVEVFVTKQKANGFKDTKTSRHETVDGDHGRIETRTYTAIHDVGWPQDPHEWPGLQAVVLVERMREIAGKIERRQRPRPMHSEFRLRSKGLVPLRLGLLGLTLELPRFLGLPRCAHADRASASCR
jgi:predicted transposase YbfD/YdcC